MMKVTGVEEFQRDLQSRIDKIEEAEDSDSVPIEELLTDGFVADNSSFNSVQELLMASDVKDINDLGQSEAQLRVVSNTIFDTWDDMIEAAFIAHAQDYLGL